MIDERYETATCPNCGAEDCQVTTHGRACCDHCGETWRVPDNWQELVETPSSD